MVVQAALPCSVSCKSTVPTLSKMELPTSPRMHTLGTSRLLSSTSRHQQVLDILYAPSSPSVCSMISTLLRTTFTPLRSFSFRSSLNSRPILSTSLESPTLESTCPVSLNSSTGSSAIAQLTSHALGSLTSRVSW